MCEYSETYDIDEYRHDSYHDKTHDPEHGHGPVECTTH